MEKVTLYKYFTIKDDRHVNIVASIINDKRIYLSDGSNFNDLLELGVFDKKDKKISRIDDLRILCLTTSSKSTLMWAHYADSNKGVCLALEVPKKYVYPVFYTRERVYSTTNIDSIFTRKNKMTPKKNLDKKYDMDNHKKYGFIKPQVWNYEHEYRVVFKVGEKTPDYNEPYLNVNVKRVYFGANAIGANYDKLVDLCSNKKIEKRKMNVADNRNGLTSSLF